MAVRSLKNSTIENFASYNSSMNAGYSFQDYELIESVFLASSASSVTFNNLNQYATDYKHLQLRAVLYSNQANLIPIRINATNGVRSHVLRGRAGSVQSFSEVGAPYVLLAGDSSTNPAPNIIDILDAFQSGKNKTTRTFTGALFSTPEVELMSNLFTVTDPISSIEIYHPNAFSFLTGSRFSLYGIR